MEVLIYRQLGVVVKIPKQDMRIQEYIHCSYSEKSSSDALKSGAMVILPLSAPALRGGGESSLGLADFVGLG